METKGTSVDDANTVKGSADCCMSEEQAKIALAIINKPDPRFSSLGDTEYSIGQGTALYNLIKECSAKGMSGFADHFEAHVRLIKKNALQDQVRRTKFKRVDKKTGGDEYVSWVVYDTDNAGENPQASIGNHVAVTSSGTEPMEEDERQHEIQAFYSKVKAIIKDMPFDTRTKQAFLLYMGGMNYVEIARAVYGYSNLETKKIYTNKVSCAIHSVCMKLRAAHGEEAKMILRPVVHVYERYV